MVNLALHTGATIVHWEYNKSCIFVLQAKIVNPRVKHIEITVYFQQEKFDNSLFTEYEKSSVVPADMCTKPCSATIISISTK